MNKRLKRMIASLSAMMMCAVSFTSVNSNAYWFYTDEENYLQEVESCNSASTLENRSDLCERFTKLIIPISEDSNRSRDTSEKEVKNIWITKEPGLGYGPLTPSYKIDVLLYQSMYVYIDISEMKDLTPETVKQEIELITNESNKIEYIEAELYSEEKLEEGQSPDSICVQVFFSDDNHNENYKLSADIVSALKKYNITSSKFLPSRHLIERRRLYLKKTINFGLLTDDEVNEINEDFKEHGFDVHLDKRDDVIGDNYYVIYDESKEWTYEEALDIAVYCAETYGNYPEGYCECSLSMTKNTSLDLLNLTGDVNEDNQLSMSDVVVLMQSITNPDEYSLTEQGTINADVNKDGNVSTIDALYIQEMIVAE